MGGAYNFKHQKDCQVSHFPSVFFLKGETTSSFSLYPRTGKDTTSVILKPAKVSYIVWNAYYVHIDPTFNFQKDQSSYKLKY